MITIFNIILIVATIIAGGYLWHLAGDKGRSIRTWIMAPMLALVKFYLTGWRWETLLYVPLFWAVFVLFSYGVNCPLHKFVVKIFGGKGADGNYMPVELATRATCGFFWSLAGLAFAWATGHWIHQIIYTLFLTVANAYFGTRKKVEVSEGGVGASVATAILI